MIVLVIPDIDLSNLSLWLADLDAGPFVTCSIRATIITFTQNELVLVIEYFIERDQVVFVVELVAGWEVFVLSKVSDWPVRIRVSPDEELGKLVL